MEHALDKHTLQLGLPSVARFKCAANSCCPADLADWRTLSAATK